MRNGADFTKSISIKHTLKTGTKIKNIKPMTDRSCLKKKKKPLKTLIENLLRMDIIFIQIIRQRNQIRTILAKINILSQ